MERERERTAGEFEGGRGKEGGDEKGVAGREGGIGKCSVDGTG